MRPDTHYVRAGDVHLAYHVVGEGPPDLVYVPEFWNSIEAQWEEPSYDRYLRRLASFSRLICFDQRARGCRTPWRSRTSPRWSSGRTTWEPSWMRPVRRRRLSSESEEPDSPLKGVPGEWELFAAVSDAA